MGFSIYSGKGWFRLWVLASLVFGIVLVLSAVADMPTERQVTSAYQAQLKKTHRVVRDKPKSSDFLDRFDSIRSEREVKLTPAELFIRNERLSKEYKEALAELPGKQQRLIIQGAILWVGGSLLTFIAGWLIAWVIRGFRKPQT
ncbi:hypothetical protein ACFPU0_13205 [Pseudomonas sp. GCM10022186]|uniref:hypothetical protein n=1 Tax=Pseudomonas sp. GCM10022186 TaxID=3252650 RepID=UPI00361D455C